MKIAPETQSPMGICTHFIGYVQENRGLLAKKEFYSYTYTTKI